MSKDNYCTNCNICLNDKSVRNINFDASGSCNYCKDYYKFANQLSDYKNLEKLFKERVENVRGKYDYDAVVGISGGKDSAYLLYILTTKYHLKIKAFTMDNGFFSNEAKKNVNKLVQEFNIEHEYVNFNEELLRKFYRYSMKKWLVPCIACSFIGYATMIGYAARNNAGLCIHGRTLAQMLRHFNNDAFSPLIEAGLKHPQEVNISKLYRGILNKVTQQISPAITEEMEKSLAVDFKKDRLPEFLAYFLYHPYSEEQIIEELETNTLWRRAKKRDYDHYDCLIHNAAHYIYQVAEGRPHELPEISAMIRAGAITREQGEILLDKARLKKIPEDELKALFDFVHLNRRFTLMKAKIYQKMKS